MKCRDLREQFSAYLDGELPREEAQAVRGHVEHCAECARELEALRRTIKAVADLPEVEAPAGLKAKIFAELEVDAGGRGKERGVSRMRTLWPAAAAIVIAVVLAWHGGIFGSRGARRTEVARVMRRRNEADHPAAERPAGGEALRRRPTIGAAPAEKADYRGGMKKRRLTGEGGGGAFKLKGGRGVSQTANGVMPESRMLLEKADKRDVLIAGAWLVPSGDPAAARALVAKLLEKKPMKRLRPAGQMREKGRAVGELRAGGITAPMEFEVTRAEWTRLLAALKKEGMTPVREFAKQKDLPRAAPGRKKLFAFAKRSEADKAAAGRVAKAVPADEELEKAETRRGRAMGQTERVVADRLDVNGAVVEEREARQPATEPPAGSEPQRRFRVRLVFPLVSSE